MSTNNNCELLIARGNLIHVCYIERRGWRLAGIKSSRNKWHGSIDDTEISFFFPRTLDRERACLTTAKGKERERKEKSCTNEKEKYS